MKPFRLICRNRDLMRRLAEIDRPQPTDEQTAIYVPTPAGLAALDHYRRDALHRLASAIRRSGGSAAMN